MSRKPRAVLIAGGVLLAAMFTVRIVAALQQRGAAARDPPGMVPPVRVVSLERREMIERVKLTGVVRPRNEVDIFTKVPGRVEVMNVKVGDRVRAGDVLAVIEHRDVEWQRQQALARARAARAALEQSLASRQTARSESKRYRALRRDEIISAAELERADATLRAAEASVRAAEAEIGVAEAAAGLAEETLRNTRVTTPIAGPITKVSVDLGTQASLGQALFQVQEVETLKVQTSATATQFARLRVGQTAHVTVDEMPDQSFSGTVATLSPSLDPQTRRAAVEIFVDNRAGELLANAFAHVEIGVGRRENVLVVPESAIVSLPEGRVFYVVRDGKAVQLRASVDGSDGFVPVENVMGSDKVIVEGHHGLADGTPVAVTGESAVEARTP